LIRAIKRSVLHSLQSQLVLGLAAVLIFSATWFGWSTYGRFGLVLLGLGGLACVAIVIRYPIVGLSFATFLFTSHFDRFIPSLRTPLLGLVVLAVLIRKLQTGDLTFKIVPLFLWTLLFFTWECLSILWATTDNPWLPLDFNNLLRALLVILAVTWCIETPRRLKFIILAGAIGTCITSILTIHSFFSFLGSGSTNVVSTTTSNVRFSGLWEDPNIMADSIIPFVGFGLILLWTKGTGFTRLLGGATVLLGLTAVAMSLSRGAAVSVIVVLLMLVWSVKRRWRVLIAVVSLVVVVLLVVPADMVGRIASIGKGRSDASINQRTEIFWGGLLMGWDHFPWGVGMNNIGAFAMYYVPSLDHGMVAHEAYIDTFAESGPVGLILFVGTLFSVLPAIRTRKWRLRDTDLGHNLAIGMTAVWVAILLAEAHYSFSHYTYIYLLLSLMSVHSSVYGSTSEIDVAAAAESGIADSPITAV
jgi:hypothetical protein